MHLHAWSMPEWAEGNFMHDQKHSEHLLWPPLVRTNRSPDYWGGLASGVNLYYKAYVGTLRLA